MYLPYLRGRQFELLALRELLKESLLGENVIPIIEPVKLSPTLISTMELFLAKRHDIAVVHNPQVGTFANELDQPVDNPLKVKYRNLLGESVMIRTHIMNQDSDRQLRELMESGLSNRDELILIVDGRDVLDSYPQSFMENPPRYNLIPDDRAFKRKIRNNRVLLEDSFERQQRNADYVNTEDEFFSDAHLYFSEEGFSGFSDYSIVGNSYSESGFAPYAVAIHIVYFDTQQNLRIRHFVSDSNDDINDPAGKFDEAVTKLAKWNERYQLHTRAIEILEEHHRDGTYPGLGTVKKLAIMHHIELISGYLDGVQG